MKSYRYLLAVVLILFSMKVFGLLTRRVEMPQVVGALVVGLLSGSACFSIIQELEFLNHTTEIGAIVLMSFAGLETDMSELRKSGRNGLVIAVIGVLVPLIAGHALASFFNTGLIAFPQDVLVGVVLTATLVNISVEAPKRMGKLSTPSGSIILGMALIDDILGVVALTTITGMADISVQLIEIILRTIAFFILVTTVGMFARKGTKKLFDRYQKVYRRFPILSSAFCLLFVYVVGAFFGVASITGIFIAGLIINGTSRYNYVQMRIETLFHLLIFPVFFANTDLKVVLPEMSTSTMMLSVLLLVLAILTKIVGYGLGVRLRRYENIQSLRIGIGMVPCGEIALIVVSKGVKVGLMNEAFFSPITIMVVLTTMITPILSRTVLKDHENDPDVHASSKLIEDYKKIGQSEKLAQKVLKQSRPLPKAVKTANY